MAAMAGPTPCPAYTYPAGAVRAWPTVDTQDLATPANFDPCAVRHPKSAAAVRSTGGPYISQADMIAHLTASSAGQWTKMRAYLVTYAAAQRLVGTDSEDPEAYPDREVWLVVLQGTGCATPSGKPGARRKSPATAGGSTTRPRAARTAAAAPARTAATGHRSYPTTEYSSELFRPLVVRMCLTARSRHRTELTSTTGALPVVVVEARP